MYTRILVPLDGSELAEQVLPYVRLLVKGDQTRIELLRVIEPVPPNLVAASQGATTIQIAANMSTQAHEYLDKMATSLQGDGLDVVSKVSEGDPASWIVDEADTESSTLIAISTHGRSGLARWAFGSVTDKVLHATTNPLLIIRSREPETANTKVNLKEIIIPLDESSLAEQILPHAVSLAKALGLKMTLLRVTPPAGDYYRFMDYPPPNFENMPEEVDAGAVEYLHRTGQELRRKGVLNVSERLLHGNPGLAITDFAQEVPNNLVAMTTHGRSGMGRWILGSVADRVVRHSGDPVLVIRAAEQGTS